MLVFIAFSAPIDGSCEAHSVFGSPSFDPAPNGVPRRAQAFDFEFSKTLDDLSGALLRAAGTGTPLNWVWIELYRRYFGPPHLTYKLEDVIITSYQTQQGRDTGNGLLEVVGINCGKITWEFG